MPVTPNVDRARLTLTSRTALVLDNIRTADPENEIAREIKAITDKPEMTAEDRQRKDRLAYAGALYLDEDGELIFPWANISRALRSGAYLIGKASLAGAVGSGISASEVNFPLNYQGPPVGKLYEDERYRLRLMVNKNPSGKKAMVPSVRPVLPDWSMEFTVAVFNEVIGWDKFARAVAVTGELVGIGNARRLGYGRFTADIQKA